MTTRRASHIFKFIANYKAFFQKQNFSFNILCSSTALDTSRNCHLLLEKRIFLDKKRFDGLIALLSLWIKDIAQGKRDLVQRSTTNNIRCIGNANTIIKNKNKTVFG